MFNKLEAKMDTKIKERLESEGFEQVLEYKDGITEVDIFIFRNSILKIQRWFK